MIRLKELTFDQYEQRASDLGVALPIEQTAAWSEYESTIEGRTPWGSFELERDGATVGLASFLDYETHGYHFLRCRHAPIWCDEPSAEIEEDLVEDLAAAVRERDSHVSFMRLAVANEIPSSRPTLSGEPYDHTVVIDVTGGDDEILSRMKPRGRRDVRKALRESPATCADETERASASFSEYYDVARETGDRDGYYLAPLSDYESMIRILGPERCRVFAGRIDDKVVTWSIVTISGDRAVRYYAGSRNDTMRLHVTDKLVYFECCELGRRGCASYDLMGIGSELTPSLMGLNEFKTKFTKEVTEVAPDRDVPIKQAFYKSLVLAKKVRGRK